MSFSFCIVAISFIFNIINLLFVYPSYSNNSIKKDDVLVEKYQQQAHEPQTPKLHHFCEYAKKAELVQNELDEVLTTFIAQNLQTKTNETNTKDNTQI